MLALLKNRVISLSASLVLLLAAFPLISAGTTSGSAVLWWIGLAVLVLGAVIPVLRRFLGGNQQ